MGLAFAPDQSVLEVACFWTRFLVSPEAFLVQSKQPEGGGELSPISAAPGPRGAAVFQRRPVSRKTGKAGSGNCG